VLFDTFVVRTVLVPAVLTLAARVNWWPRKVPQGKLMDEFGNEATDESKDQALLSVNGSSPKAAGSCLGPCLECDVLKCIVNPL